MQSTIQHKKQDAEIIRAVIKLQLIAVIVAVLAIKFYIPLAIKSTLYGSMVAVANSGFLYWRMRRADSKADATAQESLNAVYWSGIERFILIGCLLAVGMTGVLKLSPVLVLISFIIGQLVFLLGVIFVRFGKNKIKQS